MQRIIILLVIAALGWYGYGKYQDRREVQRFDAGANPSSKALPAASAKAESPNVSAFQCDGRTHCSQMTSCAQATYFLKNCPGTMMDGNNDGIPCEKQWCK